MSSLAQTPRRTIHRPFPARVISALLALPPEIILHILALLVGQTPLGPPAALIPVMLTCRELHEHATRPELLARICRFKLDVAAVQRRIITPWNVNLKEHLIYCCRLMRALRRGLPARDTEGDDVPRIQTPLEGDASYSSSSQRAGVDTDLEEIRDWDPSQVLFACLMMLLDNDGKNIAQLEWAGVHTYVRQFVAERLWDGSYLNDGWPLENDKNASALWVMWLITDQEMLEQETPAKRESFIDRIFPFVVQPQRYPSSEAPPNHFHLPLSNGSTAHIPQQVPLRFPITSWHAEAYKEPPMFPTPEHTREMERYQPQMYPHYIPSRGFVMPYFGANPFLGAPPSSMAAKLLYVARREVQGIAAPPAPYVPATRATAPPTWRGPTAEDYLVLNAAKGALTPKRTRWDWNKGYCRVVGSQQVEGQGPGDASSKKHDVIIWDGNELGETDGDDDDDKENRRPHREESELEDSRRWDTLWWRMRLCNNIYSPKPRFEAGSVYDPGCMRGSWRGKIYIPSGVPFSTLLNRAPIYPGVPDENGRFSESSIGLIMQPVFLDIQEHHRVCLGASYYRDSARGRSRRTNEREMEATSTQASTTDACGIVPVPPPAHRDWDQFAYAAPFLPQLGIHSDNEDQEGANQEIGGNGTGPSASSSTGSTDETETTSEDSGSSSNSRASTPVSRSATLDRALHVALPGVPVPAEAQPVDEQMMVNPLGAQNVPYVEHLNPEDRENDTSTDPSNESNRAVRGHDWQPENRIDQVDVSMTNAWFPGSLGSLQWAKRDGEDVDSRPDALAQGRPVRKWRDGLLVSVAQNPDINAPRGCVHPHGDDLREKGPERKETQQTWVYETYDPDRVGAHEYYTSIAPPTGPAHARVGCKQCTEREAKLKEMRELEAAKRHHREVKEHRRHLERDARRKARAESKKTEHSAAIDMLDNMMRSFGGQAADADAQMEDLDTEGGVFDVGAPEDSETEEDDGDDESDDQMSVLGDDFDGYDSDVEGRQSDNAQLRAQYYENMRRGYSPSRIMRPSTTNATTSASLTTSATTPGATACPSATADTIVTGGTPDSALIWGRRYTVYGRVRPWDGLVGMLRVGQNMLSTDYLFFFGYVVGRTFVGEWRIASSDVMRPTLGSAIVMSRYDE